MSTNNIVFTADPAKELAQFVDRGNYSKVAVLVDTNTFKHCYPVVKLALPPHELITVLAGEEYKNLQTCEAIWEEMTNAELDRHALMIVIGGGVLGDMGGFCAATYKRGIDFALVPTTLLAQVDASIGGKLGIDFNNFKNHIGVFQVPVLTVLSARFLKTLPIAEKRSGYAEVIKHVLISDAEKWTKIKESKFETQNWDEWIRHSVEFKDQVTLKDPKEKGLRKLLNAGHTIGHAIETFMLASDRKVMHGEAIAAGLITEGFIAVSKNLLSRESLAEIEQVILPTFGKLALAEEDDEPIAEVTFHDKKNKGGKILCVLLKGIGEAGYDYEISQDEIIQALRYYRSLQI